jgi:hypothetical protein
VGSQIAGTRSRWHRSGEHPRVDALGLARQRRQPLDRLRIRDLDLPAGRLELVVHEAGAVDRLDRRHDRLGEPGDVADQASEAVGVWWCRGDLDRLASPVHQVNVQAVA